MRPELHGDFKLALFQLAGLAQQHGANLLDAGDTFDTNRPDSDTVSYVQAWLTRLAEQGTQYGFVLGNHSMSAWSSTAPQLRDFAVHLAVRPMYIGEHRVAGLDYMLKHEIIEKFANLPLDATVLITHLRPGELYNFDGCHCRMADLPPQVKLWGNGDVHVIRNITNSAGVRLLSPGTPYMTALGDEQDSGAWLIDDDLRVMRLPLKRRPLIKIHLESSAEIASAVERCRTARTNALKELPEAEGLNELCASPMVVLSYFLDDNAGAPDLITDALGDKVHVFPYPLSRESRRVLEEIQAEDNVDMRELTLQKFVGEEVSQESQPLLYNALVSHLSGTPIEQVLLDVGRGCGLSEQELSSILPQR
jgi:hypothetical protein